MRVNVETITPDKAVEYLKKNTANRALRPTWVKTLAFSMRRGDWRLSHQGIAFSTAGDLLDGQHRLAAVIESGVSVEMTVARGVDPAAFISMDLGAKRSVADLLHISKGEAEALGYLAKLLTNRNPTPQLIADLRPHFHREYAQLTDGCSATRRGFSSAPVRAAAMVSMLIRPENATYVVRVYSDLIRMRTESMPKIAHVLNRLISGGHVSAVENTGKDLFVRAMFVFDPAKADLSKIQINTDESGEIRAIAAIKEELRFITNKLLSK
jgi:hypothetical protein